MNRLQRKCLLASLAVHGLLLGLLLVGPAFVRRRPPAPVSLPILHVIPANLILTDNGMSGGGSPRARQAPPEPAPTPAPPARAGPEPPSPAPEPAPEPIRTPEPPKPATARPTPDRMLSRPAESGKPASRPQIKVSNKLVKQDAAVSREPARAESAAPQRSRSSAEDRRRLAREQETAARRMQDLVSSTARSLGDNLSGGTEIDIPGPGGPAYADYRQVLQTLFYQAWHPPDGVDNDQLEVLAEIVVTRQGRIIRQKLLRPCGVGSVDRSVEEAIDRVRLHGLPAFPEASKDLERTFHLNFNLQTKRLLG